MKHIIFTLSLLFSCVLMSAQERYAVCKVIEKNHKVLFEFICEDNEDYEKKVISFRGKKLRFNDGQKAVSYLSESWGWVVSGNPIQLNKKETIWVLHHEVDKKNGITYTQNVRSIDGGQKRYGEREVSSNTYYTH